MDPIIHNFDPYIFRIGDGFGVRWYSLPYMFGMLFVYLTLRRAGRTGAIPQLNDELSESFVLLGILGALLGARFFHVFVFEFDRYGINPLAWIAVWRGGLAFHGGLVGVLLAVAWFSHKHGIGFYTLLDRITIPILLALTLGRIANFINAEMYGTPYDGPLCVDYSQNQYMAAPPEGCRHPTQLYESSKNLGLAGLLLGVREWLRPPPGVVFWSFVMLYGWIRFGLMFLRQEEVVWRGFTLSQIFSGLMGILGVIMVAQVLTTAKVGDARRKGQASAG
jgi:phosphatidylglycerol:prolipoprotein diacylglycerol transferase